MIVLMQYRITGQTLTNLFYTKSPSKCDYLSSYFCTNDRSNLFIILSFALFFYSSELYSNKIATFEENPFLSLTVTNGVL